MYFEYQIFYLKNKIKKSYICDFYADFNVLLQLTENQISNEIKIKTSCNVI